ncbi:hypothetical protein HMPREF3257_10450, partial [Staphylococcus aureus]|uniref:hypothetical protein n=1 Tax=Staphylococcus aureus TaxID=1280 RepID=UPI0009112156
KVLSYFCDKCCMQCHKTVTLELFMTPHKNILDVLKYLALPDSPIRLWGQISLMLLRSYGVLRDKLKILDF